MKTVAKNRRFRWAVGLDLAPGTWQNGVCVECGQGYDWIVFDVKLCDPCLKGHQVPKVERPAVRLLREVA
jgi:hypothetical protein